MYTEAELEQARICARIFTDGLTYRLFTEIRSGKKLITTTVTEWLKPVYFEVDKTEVFATCLDGFLRELIELEEQIRKSGVLDPDTLTEVIFEKSIEHLQEGGANETGRTRLRLFCESFIVRLVRDYPKKVAVNAVEVAARVEGKTLLDAERALVSLANADKKWRSVSVAV